MKLRTRLALPLALLVLLLTAPASHAAKPAPEPDHWVSTWATAAFANPRPALTPGVFFPGGADTTLRQIVHTSLAGPLVRIEFTNAFGTDNLTIGAAHIALAAPGGADTGDISLMTANALTFNGSPSITLPPGAEAISDPVALALPAQADLVISMFLPHQNVRVMSSHSGAFQKGFFAPGNVVGERSLTAPQTIHSWYFLKAVDVKTTANTGAIVALGDSITDGAVTTEDGNHRWPDELARRLAADKKTANLSVVNEGIGGNRILGDGAGQGALARFDRDVLALPGVRYLIVLEGINDIGGAFAPTRATPAPLTADDLIGAIAQMAERAHTHGIKVYAATLTPYMGAGYSSPAGDQVRQALNAWIRTSKLLDGFIDFEKVAESSTAPGTMNPAYDHGDHLHPNDAGMKAMAGAIDLKLFTPAK